MDNWPVSQLEITCTHNKNIAYDLTMDQAAIECSLFARRFSVYSKTCYSEKIHTRYQRQLCRLHDTGVHIHLQIAQLIFVIHDANNILMVNLLGLLLMVWVIHAT